MKENRSRPLFTFVLLVLVVVSAGILTSCGQAAGHATQPTASRPVQSSGASASKTTLLPTPSAALIPAKISSGHSIVLTLSAGVEYLGTTDNTVYALRTSNGAMLWRQHVDGSVNGQPFVSNGMLYVNTFVGPS
jgi:outer membrane protein assembly factor BamB